MYKILGLMLTRDDKTYLEDWLIKYRKEFDQIFALDGSIEYKEYSKELLLKYDVKYNHDSDYNFIKKTDHSLRSVVYDEIKKYIQNENKNIDYWIVLIHPDEFYIENLRYVINLAIKYNMELIVYNSLHNMPHIHDKQLYLKTKKYNDLNYFIHNDKNTWKEDRIFKFKNDLIYTDTHSLVIPHKVNKQNSRIFHPNLLHYKIPYIDVEKYTDNKSLKTSCWSSLSTHFPPNYKIYNIEDFFLSEPAGFYKGSKLYNKKNVLPDSLKII